MPVPFWLGNQFNYTPAQFPGYVFPQPQAQQPTGLFAPPKSLFQAPWSSGGGDGQVSEGPPGTGVPGPVGGLAQEISDFATNPGMRGMAMGIPGLGLAMGLANLGAQYSMAPPGEFSLGNFFGSLVGMQPSTQAITSIALDPMGNFGFADAPPNSFNEAGQVNDSRDSDSASASPGGHASGPGGDPGVGGGEGGGAPGAGGGDDGSGDGVGGAAGGPGGGPGGDGGDGGDGWAKGGRVTGDRLTGMDPPGPDDGYGALDTGEYVLTAKAAKKIGAKNLAKLNKGKFNKAALAKSLKVKKSKLKKVRQPGGN